MKRAIKAGVTSIEHGTYMDEEAIDLMKQNNTYYVPTIMAGKFVADKAKIDGYFPELVRPKAAEIGPLIQDTFAKTWDKTDWNRTVLGVPVGQKDPRFSSSPSIVFIPSSQEDELCRNDREKQDQ